MFRAVLVHVADEFIARERWLHDGFKELFKLRLIETAEKFKAFNFECLKNIDQSFGGWIVVSKQGVFDKQGPFEEPYMDDILIAE